jgi:hypothetical protein
MYDVPMPAPRVDLSDWIIGLFNEVLRSRVAPGATKGEPAVQMVGIASYGDVGDGNLLSM